MRNPNRIAPAARLGRAALLGVLLAAAVGLGAPSNGTRPGTGPLVIPPITTLALAGCTRTTTEVPPPPRASTRTTMRVISASAPAPEPMKTIFFFSGGMLPIRLCGRTVL